MTKHEIAKRFIPPMGNFHYDTDTSSLVATRFREEFMVVNFSQADVNEGGTSATDSTALIVYDIFIPLLGIFIIFFNLLVVISSGLILKKGQQPRTTYLFLGNVGMSDLVTGFAVLFGYFYPSDLRGEINCSLQIGMIVSSTLTSIYSVLLIAVDRFLYILKGLMYQVYITPNRARFLIAVTWIIGIIVGFLPAFGWRGDTNNGQICWFILLAPPELVLLTTLIGLIPILIVFILYAIILYRAILKINEIKRATSGTYTSNNHGNLRFFRGGSTRVLDQIENENESRMPLQNQPNVGLFSSCCKRATYEINNEPTTTTQPVVKQPSKWKAVKVVLFTTGSFIVTWIPYFIASTMFVYCDNDRTPDLCRNLKIAVASPLAVLGFANSLLNPIIYAWWHNGFRKSTTNSLKRLKCCRCCYRNKSIESAENNSLQPRVTNTASTSINLNSTSTSALNSSTSSQTRNHDDV